MKPRSWSVRTNAHLQIFYFDGPGLSSPVGRWANAVDVRAAYVVDDLLQRIRRTQDSPHGATTLLELSLRICREINES